MLPWKTVKENVVFALVSSGKLTAKPAEEKALEYINKVNLTKSPTAIHTRFRAA